jgi:hypothetical protein
MEPRAQPATAVTAVTADREVPVDEAATAEKAATAVKPSAAPFTSDPIATRQYALLKSSIV